MIRSRTRASDGASRSTCRCALVGAAVVALAAAVGRLRARAEDRPTFTAPF